MTSNVVVISIVGILAASWTAMVIAFFQILANRVERLADRIDGQAEQLSGMRETLAHIDANLTSHIEAYPGHHERIRT